uniref:Uncharacterized protein n=1 Tax=Rhizophora mucronata TaxID=61149 RepID=A0A2P2PD39_RHIMU
MADFLTEDRKRQKRNRIKVEFCCVRPRSRSSVIARQGLIQSISEQ